MPMPERSDQPLIAGARAFTLDSASVGDTLTLFTGRCGVTREIQPEVTLYVTDGNANFGLATEIIRSYALAGILPPTLVVAIGYPDPASGMVTRNRDLPPTRSSGRGMDDAPDSPVGRADALMTCIAEEVQPWVESTFGVPARRAYTGQSLGGLFGAWALLKRPSLFDDYILSSPSTWWDDELLLRADHVLGDDAERRVFVGIGSEETGPGPKRLMEKVRILRGRLPEGFEEELGSDLVPIDMVDVGLRFADRLRGLGLDSLRVRSETFELEHHTTAFPAVLGRGLRWLYGDLSEPVAEASL